MEITTSIIIFAPHEVQAFAAPLMKAHCLDSLIRVPAHITLLIPFAPLDSLPNACAQLRDLCAETAPFDVTLDGYGFFPTVIYMKPADPEPIKGLARKIFARFPQYPPYRGLYGDDLVPHLTVAEFARPEERAATVLPAYPPFTFTVRRLHVVTGIEHQPYPWITEALIPLEGNTP